MQFKKTRNFKTGMSLYAPLLLCLFASCSSTKMATNFLYFQRGLDSMGSVETKEIAIKNSDVLNIQISSKSLNQEQTLAFNNPASNGVNQGYVVNGTGVIDLPMIGHVKASGMTTDHLQAVLLTKVNPYVKDAVVKVGFAQFNINVLGEVRLPGTKSFQTENVNIIDAISAAGDLTDYGKREDITVIRVENGTRKYYKIDLRGSTFFQSPAYQLQPNDLVYVGASENKLITVAQDPNKGRGLGTALQFTSILVALGTLIITLIR